MSRSSYNERTTTSGPAYDRDYEDRKERERERMRSADRYDTESRHHGKWTASGESTDLENSAHLPGAYNDARRSQREHLGSRSYSDREAYNRDYSYDRSRGYSGSYGSYDNGSGFVPPPPPMPPSNFWMPHNSYRNSHPYQASYGHMSYDGRDFSGAQAGHFGHGMRGLDSYYGLSGYGGDYGYSGEHVPSYGWFHPGMYSHDSLLTRDLDYLSLGSGSRSVIPGATRHLELGTTRPHVDIYELANEYIIEIDLPGHSRDHIETKLFGNELVITSRPPKRTFDFHINERPLGRHEVTRKFYLPADVNHSKINASLTNGVLRMALPRNLTGSNATQATTTTVVDTSGSTTTTTQAVVV